MSRLENGILPTVLETADLWGGRAARTLCRLRSSSRCVSDKNRNVTYFAVLRPFRMLLGLKVTIRDMLHSKLRRVGRSKAMRSIGL
jgi:hypothetical protein